MKFLYYLKDFISTPRRDHPAKTLQDIPLFDRKIKLKYHFNNDSDQNHGVLEQTNNQILHPSSGWTPPSGQDPFLDSYRNSIINSYLKELENPTTSKKKSLSHKELQAMRNLHNNGDITIKSADKGGSIVIMNTTDYIQETLKTTLKSRTLQNHKHRSNNHLQQIHTPHNRSIMEIRNHK